MSVDWLSDSLATFGLLVWGVRLFPLENSSDAHFVNFASSFLERSLFY